MLIVAILAIFFRFDQHNFKAKNSIEGIERLQIKGKKLWVLILTWS